MASEIIVGLDFGTTYTKVSWAVNGGNRAIRMISDWPNPRCPNETTDKVPSKISYKDGKPFHWGFTVTLEEPSFQWFKLLLNPEIKVGWDSQEVEASQDLLSQLGKTAEDVAADYLSLIWKYTLEDIKKDRGPDWHSVYALKLILTVPAIWSPAAKDRTLRVARRADIAENIQIDLVTEPEAAALAVLKGKHEDVETMNIGDCFVVCDAGGGTVDLISYKVCGLDPLQIEECAVGDGAKCGSALLDQFFWRYITVLVGEQQWNKIRNRYKARMMEEFELVKRSFSGDDNTNFSVQLRDVENNRDIGIDDETILLTPSNLRTNFDHVVNQTMRLVESQIQDVKEGNNEVKAILLVGGFGTNRYMHRRLHDDHASSGIRVLQCNGGWSAICRGATMWGLEHSAHSPVLRRTVQSRISRYSYGICVNQIFNACLGHLEEDRFKGADGQWLANNQMIWKLRKGNQVKEGRVLKCPVNWDVQVGMFDWGTKELSTPLYYCADDMAPSRRQASIKELCRIRSVIPCSKLRQAPTFKSPQTGQQWRKAPVEVRMRLNNATLHFSVIHMGETVAYTEAKYMEEF